MTVFSGGVILGNDNMGDLFSMMVKFPLIS